MNAVLFGFLNMWEAVALIALVVILFGARKLPQLARGLGESIREFKKSTREETKDTASESTKQV